MVLSEDVTGAGDADVSLAISITLEYMRTAKPSERSEKARRYAVLITEMEKVYAYFHAWVRESEGV